MNELPVKKTCTRCGETFYCMPSRLSKTPGTGHFCRACRMAALDNAFGAAAAGAQPHRGRSDAMDTDPSPGPAPGSRLYPCRICGARTVNRFYCPEHHQQITFENGPYAEDFGFGSDEGIAASRTAFMEHAETSVPDA
ncbi:hypothetical protein DPQ33_13100 [Oceanidesulfovibrio indonesiensis]|uniref:Uncharacterized protein n=1 Tax=Oceanidesulfovibrio indonesiensis TaxID=54767 RepID=A0A7M3MDE5_9BACT|nr:hypothetical protein [Oceanidesulfovibrio indonesiensis]TVM16251.1 hypothetical protein DPQ33_13100 [Oceanidesulfovibrio indonesiensis]